MLSVSGVIFFGGFKVGQVSNLSAGCVDATCMGRVMQRFWPGA